MRIVILCSDQSNQKALCHKLNKVCEIAAIIVSGNKSRKRISWWYSTKQLVNKIAGRTIGYSLAKTWFSIQSQYSGQFQNYPVVPIIRVDNINDLQTIDALNAYQPDLIVVSGTNIVGNRIIDIANRHLGIVNLHTGISPYVKGGPNCTNWCLTKRLMHLIGNTVMWLDKGIDTGKIIVTEQTPLFGNESLFELHWKVMEHAHHICVETVSSIKEGRSLPAIPQNSIDPGKTFYTIQWNGFAMGKALYNFRKYFTPGYFKSAEFIDASKKLKLFHHTGE